jgi:hypothetical protein
MARRRNTGGVERISLTISPELKRLLDGVAEGLGMTRSEAAARAISEWVRRVQEGDLEEVYGLSAEVREQADRLARMISEAQVAAGITYEALAEGSPRVRETDYEDLRRRAVRRRRGR